MERELGGPGSMRELFIYWKARAAAAEAAERDAAEWQAELRRAVPGLGAALLRRADDTLPAAPATATLMETYAGPALDAALERRIVSEGDARLARWIEGVRKVEVFVRCTPV